jgi:hypothetical protein
MTCQLVGIALPSPAFPYAHSGDQTLIVIESSEVLAGSPNRARRSLVRLTLDELGAVSFAAIGLV